MNWEDRALRSNEYMKLLTALWSQERPAFRGRTVAAEGFYFNPKTVQQPHPPFIGCRKSVTTTALSVVEWVCLR